MQQTFYKIHHSITSMQYTHNNMQQQSTPINMQEQHTINMQQQSTPNNPNSILIPPPTIEAKTNPETIENSKQCPHHHKGRKRCRRIFGGIIAFIVTVLIVIFLSWLILRPTKPRFVLEDATVSAFNISCTADADISSLAAPPSNHLNLTMQATITGHNPNSHVGIYYENLHVYAAYRGQQISIATELLPSFQDHHDVTIWSPYLYGPSVPISESQLEVLKQDQNAGMVLVNVKVNGEVKWKVGSWVSGRYHLNVNCPAYIKLAGNKDDAAPAVKFQLQQSCIVDV